MTRRPAAGMLGKVRGLVPLLVFPLILACGGSDGGTVRSDDTGTEETTTTSTSTSTSTSSSSVPTTRGQVTTTRPSTPRTTEPSD